MECVQVNHASAPRLAHVHVAQRCVRARRWDEARVLGPTQHAYHPTAARRHAPAAPLRRRAAPAPRRLRPREVEGSARAGGGFGYRLYLSADDVLATAHCPLIGRTQWFLNATAGYISARPGAHGNARDAAARGGTACAPTAAKPHAAPHDTGVRRRRSRCDATCSTRTTCPAIPSAVHACGDMSAFASAASDAMRRARMAAQRGHRRLRRRCIARLRAASAYRRRLPDGIGWHHRMQACSVGGGGAHALQRLAGNRIDQAHERLAAAMASPILRHRIAA